MAHYRETHRKIRELFNISNRKSRRDNMPIGAKSERETLGRLFCELGLNRGAEIGVKRGYFSHTLCQANPNIELYCIDPWVQSSDKNVDRQRRHNRYYKEAVSKLSSHNARFVKLVSMEAIAYFKDQSFDFVYIDGNHSFDFVCPDIIFWSQKVRSGGIVACHDYFAHHNGGVTKAVEAYTHCHNIRPWYSTVEVFPTAFWVKP